MNIQDNELKFASIDMSSVADIYTFLLEEKGLMIHPKTSYNQCIKEKRNYGRIYQKYRLLCKASSKPINTIFKVNQRDMNVDK